MPYEESDLDLFQDAEDQDQEMEDMEDDQPLESEPISGYDNYEEDGEGDEDDEDVDDQVQPASQSGDQDIKLEDREHDQLSGQPVPQDHKAHLVAGTYRSSNPVKVDQEIVDAQSYNLTPTTAFIQGCATFSMAFSWGTKMLFTGGDDGYIRRYAFPESVTGQQPLTIGQRPSFVDTILNGGLMKGYWENEEPLPESEYKFDAQGTYVPQLSPVYSLAAHSEALWVAAGLKSGGINIQTVRHSEGTIVAHLDLHSSTVSELALDSKEQHLLSGSWDKTVAYWDLDTGTPVRHYTSLNGQVSTIAWQPVGGPLCAPEDNKSMDSLFGDEEDEQDQQVKAEQQDQDEAPSEKLNTGNAFLTSTVNGAIEIWDVRTTEKCLQLMGSSAPPWCISACWSPNGTNVFAGRRNNSVDEYDVRMSSKPTRTFKFPSSSGSVTGLVAMPNGRQLLCSSNDNLRLYDLTAENKKTPFYIVPSHHGVTVSRLLLDPSGRYLLTASGGRGWSEGPVSDMVLCYEVSTDN